jgi:hypothetical protein
MAVVQIASQFVEARTTRITSYRRPMLALGGSQQHEAGICDMMLTR